MFKSELLFLRGPKDAPKFKLVRPGNGCCTQHPITFSYGTSTLTCAFDEHNAWRGSNSNPDGAASGPTTLNGTGPSTYGGNNPGPASSAAITPRPQRFLAWPKRSSPAVGDHAQSPGIWAPN